MERTERATKVTDPSDGIDPKPLWAARRAPCSSDAAERLFLLESDEGRPDVLVASPNGVDAAVTDGVLAID